MSGSKAPSIPPPLAEDAHKGAAGRVLVLAGSSTMPGAANLVLRATQRGGAGLVTLGVLQAEVISMVAPAVPEAIYLDLSRSKDLFVGRLPDEIKTHDHDARVAGPGLGRGGSTRELIRLLLRDTYEGPLVLDADALNSCADRSAVLGERESPLVITPHPGEASRLLGREVPPDGEGRLDAARELSSLTRSICVLKGAGTIVAEGDQHWVNRSGNPGMATAGSGDVLTGLLGAYAATAANSNGQWSLFDATCAAVYVHGLAGDLAAERLGQRAVVASDLIDELGPAQKTLS